VGFKHTDVRNTTSPFVTISATFRNSGNCCKNLTDFPQNFANLVSFVPKSLKLRRNNMSLQKNDKFTTDFIRSNKFCDGLKKKEAKYV